jgi:UDP-sulfoquinovose synthase
MRVLILGADGYLGWATAMYFSKRGHDVHGVDNYLRRRAQLEQDTESLTPIVDSLPARARAWASVTRLHIGVTDGISRGGPVVGPGG